METFFRNVGMSPHDVINQKNNVNKPKLFVVFKFPVTNKRYTANNVAKCNVVMLILCGEFIIVCVLFAWTFRTLSSPQL
jgi:hypothetical protein